MGENLRHWVINELSKSGWTMNELARRSKLSSGYVSQILSGVKEPGAKFYQGVAKAFGVTLESVERLEIDGIIPESRIDDPTYLELVEIAQTLPDSDLKELLNYANYRLWLAKKLIP